MHGSKRRAAACAVVVGAGAMLVASSALAAQEAQIIVPPGSVVVERGYVAPKKDFAPPPSLQVGIRAAAGLGFGNVYQGLGVADGAHASIPVIVDIGVRPIPELYIGGFGQWAHVIQKENPVACPAGTDCTASDWRFGLQVDLHPVPHGHIDPYVGFGAGYEILRNHVTGNVPVATPVGPAVASVNATATDRGWEYGAGTLGFDYRTSRNFGIGPFFTATIAQYNVHEGQMTVSVAGTSRTTPLPTVRHLAHELLFAGIRGSFNL